ncbi:unnamed protein product [Hermetia illucens]|uniref:Uncharacterized protein n=1 Tax=Hermetia illucens TaxID=343691 RepID=A0A7R8UAK4_HERIL|nr:unnamed protein product [Hermetia illucens]
MLVYLLLWFYLLRPVISLNNGFEDSTEGKSYSRKYRNPERGFKQHIVSHNFKSPLSPYVKKDNPIANNDISSLLSKLRDNWEPPSTYLEKRGYLSEKKPEKNLRIQHKAFNPHIGADSDIQPLKQQTMSQIPNMKDESKQSEIRLTNERKFFYYPSNKHLMKKKKTQTHKDHRLKSLSGDAPVSPETKSENAETTPSKAEPTSGYAESRKPKDESSKQIGKEPSFMSKFKNKFQSWFRPSSTADDSDFGEGSLRIGKVKKSSGQKFFDFKYDDSWLREEIPDTADLEGRHYISSVSSNSSTITDSLPSGDVSSMNSSDLMKNLTQADIDYVKSFLKCYRENKAKFFVDYLHMNKTLAGEATAESSSSKVGSAKSSNSTSEMGTCSKASNSSTKHDTTVTNSTTMKPKKVETNTSQSKTTPAPVKEEDNVKLDIDIKTNDTGNEKNYCSTTTTTGLPADIPDELNASLPTSSESKDTAESTDSSNSSADCYSNLLKFLAHQHHTVFEVGKLPHKPLNLTWVKQMIADARETLDSVILGDGGGNDTKCTPIRLNELNFDVEWTSQQDPNNQSQALPAGLPASVNNERAKKDQGDAATHFLLDAPETPKLRIEPPYSDNFLISDSLIHNEQTKLVNENENSFAAEIKKKRDIPQEENGSQQESEDGASVDRDYFDMSPSLEDFSASSNEVFPFENYLDDYGTIFEPRKRKSSSDDDDDGDEEEDNSNELFGRKKKKKKKKKKKYNKKSNENDDATEISFEETDPGVVAQEREDGTAKKTAVEAAPPKEDYTSFSELNDIKFRVNSDQEEAIEKFIEGLNAPPEIFNFDVERFIKSKSSFEPIHLEQPPQKTFYEFIASPNIENERVPYIAPDTLDRQSQAETSGEASPKESRNVHTKRDILRQYIKGISEHLQDAYAAPPPAEEKTTSKLSRSNCAPINRDQVLISNYANDLDVLNYGRFEPIQRDSGVDDFVDKFYLLNDGSFSIYGADKPPVKSNERNRIDPVNVDIDLDLDKKFKELSIARPAPTQVLGKCTGLDCSKDRIVDWSNHIQNNFDLFVPDTVFHKELPPDKACDRCLPMRRK